MTVRVTLSALASLACALAAGQLLDAAAPPRAAKRLQFNRDVRPLLSDACFTCHGPDKAKRKADLRLDTAEGRKAVVPGRPDDSELIKRVASHDPHDVMPPTKTGRRLSAEQIATLREWVRQGATWQDHWAYVAPKRPPVPESSAPADAGNPIDRFVAARLDAEGLLPSPAASRRTLVRRLTLDLTGLPPSPAEADAFAADDSPEAYERLVDRLLASPRFGERLAYDWLDSARYADSNGYQADRDRIMWPWRDWAVAALNANAGFDRFTVEQLAGDLLPDATQSQKIATGFHRNHMLNGEGGRVQEESRIDYVNDRVETTATVWLGLTLGCARCHDHKYDPFSMVDYYRLFAYFNNVTETGGVDRGGNATPVLEMPVGDQAERKRALRAELKQQEDNARLAADAGSKSYFEQQAKLKRDALAALDRQILNVMVMQERPTPRPTHVLLRGAWDKPGERVAAKVVERLAPAPKGSTPDRLGLARWLVSADNPLTARVIVNRYWQLLFGRGLVTTPEDFGVQGDAPSHPELLDWLAVEFVESGWDLKRLVRLIVTSATYRQSSSATERLIERDPDNRLLARGARYRLSAHAIRDQALALAGLLTEQVGGAPVKPYQPPGIWEEVSFGGIKFVQSKGVDLHRRSLYTFWRRSVGPTNLFDVPARQYCVVRPSRTNTPVHALITLNDPTYVEAARVMAQRVLSEPGIDSIQGRLDFAFRLATGRPPDERERAVLKRARDRLMAQYEAAPAEARKLIAVGETPADAGRPAHVLAAYTGVCGMLLNLDEVITRE